MPYHTAPTRNTVEARLLVRSARTVRIRERVYYVHVDASVCREQVLRRVKPGRTAADDRHAGRE